MLGDSKVNLRATGAPEEESSPVQAQVGSVPGVLEHGGEGGSLRYSMGQVTWEKGGAEARGQEPSSRGHTLLLSPHGLPEGVSERGWQLHEIGTPYLPLCPQAYRETLRNPWAGGQLALSHHPLHSDPQIGQNPLCFGLLQRGHMRRLVDVVCCGP